MTVSGSDNFTVNRDEIIKAALRVMGALGVGEEPIQEDYTNCSQALNIMIKSWAKKGLPLWVTEYLQIPMIEGANPYPIGPTAGYVFSVTSTGGTGYTAGTWTASGGTTGTSASGTYTVSDGAPDEFTVLVAGDSYTSSPTLTLSGAGTGATITVNVVGVTNPRPLRIIEAFIRNSQGADTTLLPIARQQYDILGVKTTSGIPNQFYYDNQLENGNLYVYNVPSDSDRTIYATIQRMFYDMDSATDTFDFPQEWFQALKWGLANELSDEYGVEENKIFRIQQKAEQYLMECSDWSQEEATILFTVDQSGTTRYGRA